MLKVFKRGIEHIESTLHVHFVDFSGDILGIEKNCK